MRAIISGIILATPLLFAVPAAHAQNDIGGQLRQFLGNGNNQSQDRNAYEQGRRDEMRQQQADRERRREERDMDRDRNPGYHHDYDRDQRSYNGYNSNRY